eukprot:1177301-Prorocentrum_minimum.AAC.2
MYLYLGEWNPRLWGIAEVHDPVYLTASVLKLGAALTTTTTTTHPMSCALCTCSTCPSSMPPWPIVRSIPPIPPIPLMSNAIAAKLACSARKPYYWEYPPHIYIYIYDIQSDDRVGNIRKRPPIGRPLR